jgi:O-antigen ligase
LAVLVLAAAVLTIGSQNRYFSRLWRYFTEPNAAGPNRTFLEYVGFRQRFAYAETAFRIYAAHPILGVGLGNYAFYFEEMLPDLSWSRYPEIIRYITPAEDAPRLITPKNLLARLLAETGLAGTILFTAFILAVCGCAFYLWFSASAEGAYWGLAGLLALIAFPIMVFSFDSLALPNMWVVFGLITAAAHMPESTR